MSSSYNDIKVVWCNLWEDIIIIIPMLSQPKFIFLSLATLSVSTCGIWISPFFLSDATQLGFSIFSFVIATLGVLAAENFLRVENLDMSSAERYRRQVKASLMVLVWVIAFACSFTGIQNKVGAALWISLILTVILWLAVTVHKSDYNVPKQTPDSVVNEALQTATQSNEPGGGL